MKNKNKLLLHIGEKIREARKEKHLSQEELADIAGVHRTYIGMIERGEKNISILSLEKIAVALELSTKDLL